jgi:hypothetical protein
VPAVRNAPRRLASPEHHLALDDFDADYLRRASTATCPNCSYVVELDMLVVDGDVWRFV